MDWAIHNCRGYCCGWVKTDGQIWEWPSNTFLIPKIKQDYQGMQEGDEEEDPMFNLHTTAELTGVENYAVQSGKESCKNYNKGLTLSHF